MNVLKYRESVAAPWQTLIGIKGEKGDVGATGPKGDAYILTEDDKAEIVALMMTNFVDGEEASF